MDVHARLVAAVTGATSPASALTSAIRVAGEALRADTCSIFVSEKSELRLSAHFGPPADAAALAAASSLAARAVAQMSPVRGETGAASLVAAPVAAINEAIGAIVARREAAAPFTVEETMRLSGIASQTVELIEGARLIETIGAAEAADGREKEPSEPPPSVGERTLRGIAASPGIAMGIVTFRNAFPRALVRREAAFLGALAESERVRDAVEKTRNDLVRLQTVAASEIGEEQALVFGTHLLLLNDPMFKSLVDESLAGRRAAAVSVDDAFAEIIRRLRDARDRSIQERIEDVEDVRSRLLNHLVGAARTGELDARLVVSARTTPSLIIELKARGALGIASEIGGATSHGVLLARALGVPAVTGIERLTHEVGVGDLLIVDGDDGLVVIRPTSATIDAYERRRTLAERRRTEYVRYRDRPATTADGTRFGLQANIALGADLDTARANRADGIGLYRTEFPFIVRDALPTVEEQVRIYAKAYEAFPTDPVTLRLLDLAGDKFLPSGGLEVSPHAFHGYRSIRILFDYPHVLRDQVRAFAIAAAGRELRILIPMVTSMEDVVRIKQLVGASLSQAPRKATPTAVRYGAMIETPASVEIVAELAREVDFFSLGTNDLIQYALVVDREDPRMASETHAYHPAILRMIQRAVQTAHRAGKQVTVCGEMAARPDLAIALLAIGVDALSVTPRVIPELKQALARISVEPLRASIGELLAVSSADRVHALLRRYASEGTPITA